MRSHSAPSRSLQDVRYGEVDRTYDDSSYESDGMRNTSEFQELRDTLQEIFTANNRRTKIAEEESEQTSHEILQNALRSNAGEKIQTKKKGRDQDGRGQPPPLPGRALISDLILSDDGSRANARSPITVAAPKSDRSISSRRSSFWDAKRILECETTDIDLEPGLVLRGR